MVSRVGIIFFLVKAPIIYKFLKLIGNILKLITYKYIKNLEKIIIS